VERLRAELAAAFAARARLYVHLRRTLAAELGEAQAEALLARAIEEWGRETGARLFAGLPAEPRAIADRFLSLSPDEGQLFPYARTDADGTTAFHVHRCPLLEAWRDLPEAETAVLCRLAGAFDKGCFEVAGVSFANETWQPGHDGCCRIRLAPA
jgi:predicted ArsR family transcriptional regulator